MFNWSVAIFNWKVVSHTLGFWSSVLLFLLSLEPKAPMLGVPRFQVPCLGGGGVLVSRKARRLANLNLPVDKRGTQKRPAFRREVEVMSGSTSGQRWLHQKAPGVIRATLRTQTSSTGSGQMAWGVLVC